jgi:hypothetical protein
MICPRVRFAGIERPRIRKITKVGPTLTKVANIAVRAPEETTIPANGNVMHLRYALTCVLSADMRFTWDETKRRANLSKHGLDFADAEKVFAGPLVLVEDNRRDYGEQRMIGIGLLNVLVVLIVHVESEHEIRIISMRKATSDETDLFYRNAGYF